MFDYPLLEGERQTALQQPNSIVLTESAARELFGNAGTPSARTVSHFGEDTLLFSGNGHPQRCGASLTPQFQFYALQSFNTVYKPDWMMSRWGDNDVNILPGTLAPNTDMAALEKKFPSPLSEKKITSVTMN